MARRKQAFHFTQVDDHTDEAVNAPLSQMSPAFKEQTLFLYVTKKDQLLKKRPTETVNLAFLHLRNGTVAMWSDGLHEPRRSHFFTEIVMGISGQPIIAIDEGHEREGLR